MIRRISCGTVYLMLISAIFINAQTIGTVYWTFTADGHIATTPCIGQDGTIYFGTLNGTLYAINPDSTEKWSFETNSRIEYSPAVGPDDKVYFGTYDGEFFALSQEGKLLWSYSIGTTCSSPAIDQNGIIYVVGDKLYFFDPGGTEQWSLNKSFYSSPTIGPDGTIYIGGAKLFALDSFGKEKWVFSAGNSIISSPAIDSDGVVYFGSTDTKVYAVNPDGTLKWSFKTGGAVYSSPAIGYDGVVYIGSSDNKIYAISRDGIEKWFFLMNDDVPYSPAVGLDGTIYIRSRDKCLYAIDPNGVEKWFYTNDSFYGSSPVIGSNGVVYMGDGHEVVAIHSESYGLATSNWPQKGKDASNSGNGYNPGCPIAVVENNAITAQLGNSSILNGNQSYDPDGDDLSYLWRCVSKPLGSDIMIDDSTSAVIEVRASGKGIYRFSLTVSDGQDGASVQFVNLNFEVSSENVFADIGAVSTLDGRMPDDLSGTVYSYLWECIDKPEGSELTVSNLNEAVIEVSCSLIGYYEFGLVVSDNEGVIYGKNVILHYGFKSFSTGSGIQSSPAIDKNGTVYIGSNDNKLYAINTDGSEKWTFETGDNVSSSPAIGDDGTIFIGSEDNKLYAINTDGSEKWAFDTGSYVISSPAIGNDGTIYVSSFKNKFFAINPDGSEKWTFDMIGSSFGYATSSPAIDSDGTIYIRSSYDRLYAVYPDGNEKWSLVIKEDVIIWNTLSPSVSIGSDGTIYIGSWENAIYAINQDGSVKWKFNTSNIVESSIAIGSNGMLSVGAGSTVYAINSDGTENWSFPVNGSIRSSPAIDSNGIIYVGTRNNTIYAISPDGSEKWTLHVKGDVESSPAIGSNGILYFGSMDKNLYMIQTESQGLACSAWPKFRQDNTNQGLSDHIPPSKVLNLLPAKVTNNSIHLKWSAPGDDGYLGTAKLYDLRYQTKSPATDTTAWWNTATKVNNMPLPSNASVYDSVIVSGLDSDVLYYFILKTMDDSGNWSSFSNVVEAKLNKTGIEIENVLPASYHLHQNFPNPFNPKTTIDYTIPKLQNVRIEIFNLNGCRVATLVDEFQSPGYYSVTWDAKDQQRDSVADGVYLCRLRAGSFSQVIRMLYIR